LLACLLACLPVFPFEGTTSQRRRVAVAQRCALLCMCILGTEEEEGEKEKAVLLPMDQVACLLVC